jgi:3-deoxy-D-manno-octulosonate 8-phosphate phosphatase (KDO 8-P phosphatase)
MAQDDTCSSGSSSYPSDCELTQALLKKARNRQESTDRGYVWKSCLPKAKGLKLFLLDVDGVLTDGTITYTHEGNEIKSFNTKDGLGIRLLMDSGIEVGIITARESEAVNRRVQDLGLKHVFQKVGFAATVADAVPEVLKIAHFVTKRKGGKGAVREVCDLILEANGTGTIQLEKYLKV